MSTGHDPHYNPCLFPPDLGWWISKQASCFLPDLSRHSCAAAVLAPRAFSLRLLLVNIIIPHFLVMGLFQKRLLNLNSVIRSLEEACEAQHQCFQYRDYVTLPWGKQLVLQADDRHLLTKYQNIYFDLLLLCSDEQQLVFTEDSWTDDRFSKDHHRRAPQTQSVGRHEASKSDTLTL